MLFVSQHSLIIKNFKIREKWGAVAPLAPLDPPPLLACNHYDSHYIHVFYL